VNLGVDDATILIEPVGRNTAPAILTAALHAAVEAGVKAAETGQLVTFGITPDRPETGYGYLELGDKPKDGVAQALKGFKEKPDAP